MTAKYDTFTTNFPGVTVQLDRDIPGKVRRVHVMSAHAFGEIRSYVLDEANELRLAGPCYTGYAARRRWAERKRARQRRRLYLPTSPASIALLLEQQRALAREVEAAPYRAEHYGLAA